MARVYIREDRCKGCGHCIDACPKNIVEFSKKLNEKGCYPAIVTEENMGKCIGCTSCGRVCPDNVFTIEK